MTDDRLPNRRNGSPGRDATPCGQPSGHPQAGEIPLRKVEAKVIENGKQTGSSPDPGLATLVMLLRFYGVGVDPAQISHQFGATPIGVPEMLRCAKGFNLKARCLKTTWSGLPVRHCPE